MKKTIRSLLLLSAVVCVTPAYANYFSNPAQGVNLNIGSAPNPTPADLRRGAVVEERSAPYADSIPASPPAFVPVFDAPAPLPAFAANEPAPSRIEAPAPEQVTRQFILFFDFDKSRMTTEAERIVADAVTTAKNTGRARISIVGHTDTVGSMRYNQALSERRAMAVKAEMVRFGMNAGDISISGRGFSDPLVPTGLGIREPENRRAVIDLDYNLTAELTPQIH